MSSTANVVRFGLIFEVVIRQKVRQVTTSWCFAEFLQRRGPKRMKPI